MLEKSIGVSGKLSMKDVEERVEGLKETMKEEV
jgi:hypothetical protein